jgi:hypothetical protein
VQRIQRIPDFSFLGVLLLLALTAAPATAQRTVVQDAGGGRKLELHYDAAGQVVETRTIGADGQLLQKQVLEYSAGAYVPQSISTSYWPNGKVHKITRNSYDDNSNFMGEFVQVFDDSGKQVDGHELKHDPQTNTYHCTQWNVAAQKFLTVKCPAGEESSGPPETAKKFTPDEVTGQLARARQAAQQPPKNTPATSPAAPTAGTNVKEVALILPARIRPGDRVSGSVVEDPGSYAGLPGILVTRVALPFAPSGAGSTLAGWTLEMSGEPPQAATGPIALTIPPGQIEVAVLFRQTDREGTPVSKAIPLPHPPAAKAKPLTSYQAPAICLKGQLCVVRGPFGGDSSKTFAAFEDRPAQIVAETSDTAYIAIPDRTEAGSRPLVIAEGSKAIAFPVVVAEFSIPPDRRDLPQGQQLLMYATIDGPQELPDPLWAPGNYPAANLDEARKLIPGFQQPRANGNAHERREADEKREANAKGGDPAEQEQEEDQGGEILLVVKNLSPGQVSLRESQNGTFVFHLKASSFSMGEFKYKFVVEANQSGTFAVKGYVIPFLAPLPGQEFPVTSASAR